MIKYIFFLFLCISFNSHADMSSFLRMAMRKDTLKGNVFKLKKEFKLINSFNSEVTLKPGQRIVIANSKDDTFFVQIVDEKGIKSNPLMHYVKDLDSFVENDVVEYDQKATEFRNEQLYSKKVGYAFKVNRLFAYGGNIYNAGSALIVEANEDYDFNNKTPNDENFSETGEYFLVNEIDPSSGVVLGDKKQTTISLEDFNRLIGSGVLKKDYNITTRVFDTRATPETELAKQLYESPAQRRDFKTKDGEPLTLLNLDEVDIDTFDNLGWSDFFKYLEEEGVAVKTVKDVKCTPYFTQKIFDYKDCRGKWTSYFQKELEKKTLGNESEFWDSDDMAACIWESMERYKNGSYKNNNRKYGVCEKGVFKKANQPCHSRELHSHIYHSYMKSMKCLGITPEEYFRVINHESQFHINVGNNSGVYGAAQLDSKAMTEVRRRIAYESNQGRKFRENGPNAISVKDYINENFDDPTCKEVIDHVDFNLTKGKGDKSTSYYSNACDRMSFPENPTRSFIYGALYYRFFKKDTSEWLDGLNLKLSSEARAKLERDLPIYFYNGGYEIKNTFKGFKNTKAYKDFSSGKKDIDYTEFMTAFKDYIENHYNGTSRSVVGKWTGKDDVHYLGPYGEQLYNAKLITRKEWQTMKYENLRQNPNYYRRALTLSAKLKKICNSKSSIKDKACNARKILDNFRRRLEVSKYLEKIKNEVIEVEDRTENAGKRRTCGSH